MWRKTLYTLNVNGYSPEITALTFPLLRHYAKKIGADFHIISERKFPEWPITYEKLQIYELAKERKDEWSLYLDADALVHPETLDWTAYVPMNTVAHNGLDFANVRWRYDEYFLRDGRNVGSCNWNTIASWLCRDLWRPLDDMTPAEAVANIYPIMLELNTVVTPEHLIDDYALSRNIARFGLKAVALLDLQEKLGFQKGEANFYWHAYLDDVETKVRKMRDVLFGTGKDRIDGRGVDRGWNLPESILPRELAGPDAWFLKSGA